MTRTLSLALTIAAMACFTWAGWWILSQIGLVVAGIALLTLSKMVTR